MYRKLLQRIPPPLRHKSTLWIAGSLLVFLVYWFSLPARIFKDPGCTVLTDRYGELLGARISDDQQWRFPHNEYVPYKFKQCIIYFEDRYFPYHNGVNPIAMARALRLNLKAGKIVSGGSTLTMQVIRLSRKGQRRTIFEKLIETILATRLELTYSKDEILALYASNAPFGSNVVGLDAAAWRYFGKRSADLSWAEAATLAVLPNSPALIYPGKNQSGLKKKRDKLLLKLKAGGVLDEQSCELAMNEPLPGQPFALPQTALHLLDRAMKEGKKGSTVTSTIDGHFQEIVNDIVERFHQKYSANKINNAAVLVLDVETGSVRAYVGNTQNPGHPECGSEVDVVNAPRSTGSILKPFLYACMLNEGCILPNTLVPDIPVQLGSFNPENYNYTYDGAVPAHRALSRSLNIPAVKMLQQYGVEKFHYNLKRIGLTSLQKPSSHYGLSLIIGGGEAKLWDIAGAYASMARTLNHYPTFNQKYNRADFHPPNYLLDNESSMLTPVGDEDHSILDAAAIWFTFQAMVEVSRPDEDASWQEFSSSARIAWKTGTSYGSRDAWSVGVTPQYVVAVWVGNSDGEGRPGLTGLNNAAPILFEVLKALHPRGWFPKPYDDILQVAVCRQSGYRASPICEEVDTIDIPYRGTRTVACPYHRIVHLDASGQYQVTSQCESPDNMIHRSWFVLPPVMEFFYRSRNPFYKVLPPLRDDCRSAEDPGQSMDMIYPREESRLYIPVDLDGQRGKVVFRVAHRTPKTKIYWYIDETYVGTTMDFHQMGLSPEPGKHTLILVDQYGETLKQAFEIIERPKKP
jgi:penicillin-binding protein 1C